MTEEETVDDINDDEGPPTLSSRLATIAGAVDVLGVEVRHVRRPTQERKIPFIKWGRLLRFDQTAVNHWIDKHRHEPAHTLR